MIDWRELDKVTVFNGKDKNGNRYLSQFLKDYKETFGVHEVNAGCERCLNDYYLKLTKKLNTMSDKKQACDYKLKKKYEGIQKEFGSRDFVTNATLTNETAEFLLENHARGADLFAEMPENAPTTKQKTDQDLTLTELKAKYPDVPPAASKKKMLERIAEHQKTLGNQDE